MNAPISPPDTETELMARYGITRVSVPQYLYKTWRYTNLNDAVAQAKRLQDAPSLV